MDMFITFEILSYCNNISYLLKSSAYSSSSPFPIEFLKGINQTSFLFHKTQKKNLLLHWDTYFYGQQ